MIPNFARKKTSFVYFTHLILLKNCIIPIVMMNYHHTMRQPKENILFLYSCDFLSYIETL